MAQQRPEKHLKQILHCTRGIIFLGTPHHGSGLAHWAESLAKTIGLIKQTNPEIVAVLKTESEILERVQSGFHTMIRSSGAVGLNGRSVPVALSRLTHAVAGTLAIGGLSLCLVVTLTVLSIKVTMAMPFPA
jgi:hypothetical protein